MHSRRPYPQEVSSDARFDEKLPRDITFKDEFDIIYVVFISVTIFCGIFSFMFFKTYSIIKASEKQLDSVPSSVDICVGRPERFNGSVKVSTFCDENYKDEITPLQINLNVDTISNATIIAAKVHSDNTTEISDDSAINSKLCDDSENLNIDILLKQMKDAGLEPLSFIPLDKIRVELDSLFEKLNNGKAYDEARVVS
jgi:hypothetical protein